MIEHQIGKREKGDARAAEPATQNQCNPAMKNSAAQTMTISAVWPTSGWKTSGVTEIASRKRR